MHLFQPMHLLHAIGKVKSWICWQGLAFFTIFPFFTFNDFIPTFAVNTITDRECIGRALHFLQSFHSLHSMHLLQPMHLLHSIGKERKLDLLAGPCIFSILSILYIQ